MKNKRNLVISVFILTLFLANAWASEGASVIVVKAKGLVCDYCVRTLEKVITKQPQVEKMSVDLSTKVIEIHLKKDQMMDDQMITKLIADAGYNTESIERK